MSNAETNDAAWQEFHDKETKELCDLLRRALYELPNPPKVSVRNPGVTAHLRLDIQRKLAEREPGNIAPPSEIRQLKQLLVECLPEVKRNAKRPERIRDNGYLSGLVTRMLAALDGDDKSAETTPPKEEPSPPKEEPSPAFDILLMEFLASDACEDATIAEEALIKKGFTAGFNAHVAMIEAEGEFLWEGPMDVEHDYITEWCSLVGDASFDEAMHRHHHAEVQVVICALKEETK